MKEIPRSIKTAMVPLFLDLALVLGYLRKPYFVLAGMFFLEGNAATVLVLALAFLTLYIGFRVLRQHRKVYRTARLYAGLLILNSLINLVAVLFISADMTGFLERIFTEDVLTAFIIFQALFLLTNAWLFLILKRARRVLG